MSEISPKWLFWTPRILTIAFLAFLSLFALDVFDGKHGIWQTLLAFLIHLIPVFVLMIILALAWRWEWIGALLYAAAGLLYVCWVVSGSRPAVVKLSWIATIAGPAFIIAALFLANWLKRSNSR
jgi:hypothetical protein